MISWLGSPMHLICMPRDPFRLSSVVTSQYNFNFFWKTFPGDPLSHAPKVYPKELRRQLMGRKTYVIFTKYISFILVHLETFPVETRTTLWTLYDMIKKFHEICITWSSLLVEINKISLFQNLLNN